MENMNSLKIGKVDFIESELFFEEKKSKKEDFKNAFECFKYIYYKKKKYLGYLDDDPELEEFRKTEYYHFLKEGL